MREEHPTSEEHRGRRWPTVVAVLCVLALLIGIGAWYARDRIGLFLGEECQATAMEQHVSFRPDQMNHASTIVLLAVKRGLPARAGSIGVATAIQESKLRNLTYGDRDSVGLFQQRPSQGWGSEEEVTDPVYAANTFYSAMEKVPGWAEMDVTVIAQEVQRSLYPDAYADHEAEARVMASGLVGQTHAGVACRLDEVVEVGSSQDVLTKAERTFSGQGVVDGDTVVLEAPAMDEAWAIASWAVAHAEAEHIVRVEVADRAWDRQQDPLTWASTGGPAEGTSITITVATTNG